VSSDPTIQSTTRPATGADRAEHVAPDDRRPDSDIAPSDEVIVGALVSAFEPPLRTRRACCEHPFVQAGTTVAKLVRNAT
jgi:hypothetical protein